MIQQTISAPPWWKQMSLLVLLACFKIRAGMHINHLSKSLLSWRKSVGGYIILYCARTDDLADNFRFKMVESDVLSHTVGLLQDYYPDVRQSVIELITALAKFGRLIYYSVLCED
jgi:hypothetical protein